MQKYDWLRLFSEVRPTFLPYARFTVQTHLSSEQCQERLASVTQPQKMPALIPIRTSDDARLVFKGQVSKLGFFIVPVDRHGRPKYQGPQPFWLIGRFKNTCAATDVSVKVFLDPIGLLAALSLVIIAFIQTGETWVYSGAWTFAIIPLFLLRLLFAYMVLALPASFKAFQMKRKLKRLLEND